MQSYKARIKEAQKTIIAVMAQDVITEFGPTLAPYGFTTTSYGFDNEWELVEVTFKDPDRRDEISITVDCDSHKCGAIYYVGKQDEDDLEPCSLKTFQKKLVKWVEGLGWECPVCEGDGKIWPDEDECEESVDYECHESDGIDEELEYIQDEPEPEPEPVTCPHCQGTGKTRTKVVKEKAA